jgi:cytochrome c oxidase subunit IV
MERDDVYEYSLDTHHSEEAGKAIRKKIMNVTVLLTVITIIEVVVGAKFGRASTSGMAWQLIKWGYVALTLVKAGYIVLVFMHLGDEKRILRSFILVPYILFMIYLIFIMLMEGIAVSDTWSTYGG